MSEHFTHPAGYQSTIMTVADDEYAADIIMIGSGFAGMFAAIEASKHDHVKSIVMVDKGAVGWSGLSPWASDSRPYDTDLYGEEGSEGWDEWERRMLQLQCICGCWVSRHFLWRSLWMICCRPYHKCGWCVRCCDE